MMSRASFFCKKAYNFGLYAKLYDIFVIETQDF